MGKNVNMNAMDKLFSGLTGKEEYPSEEQDVNGSEALGQEAQTQSDAAPQSANKTNKPVKKHFCATVDVEKMAKIRAIADIEGININSLLDLAFTFVINEYEKLHGAIRVKKPRKGDVKKIFNL